MPFQYIDETNVFVKFLPASVDDAILRGLFSSYGTIKSARVMIDFDKGCSLGYGFVRFYQPSDALQAITHMSGKRMQNKILLCKLAYCSDFPEPSTNLYIKPLPTSVNQSTLKDLFSSYGRIVTMKIMRDENEKRTEDLPGNGIAFVRFEDQESATKAMEKMNGYRIAQDVPPLTIKYAECNKSQHAKLKAISTYTTPEPKPVTTYKENDYTPPTPPSTTTTITTTMPINYDPLTKSSTTLPYNNDYYYTLDYSPQDLLSPSVINPVDDRQYNLGQYFSTGNQNSQMDVYGPYYYVYYVQAPFPVASLCPQH